MESLLGPLLPLFERERAAGNAVALGVLVDTAGSTYRKPGALMLIAANGDSAGLLSGGCLEGDLAEYAHSVIDTGEPHLASYDMRAGEDPIWGLGLGCEGAMQILLIRVGPQNGWQPLAHLARCLDRHERTAVAIVVESEDAQPPVGAVALEGGLWNSGAGTVALEGDTPKLGFGLEGAWRHAGVDTALDEAARTGRTGWFEASAPRLRVFALPLTLPPKLLLLGAGADARPVVEFAARLNWKVTLVDHRPAYADPAHFPLAERVAHAQPDELLSTVDPAHFSAAVVMSHHLLSDLKYLRALSATRIPFVGLLGPAVRRERLLADLGSDADRIRQRLRAPVGLALGGRSPESIALAIIAEIHAFVHVGAAHVPGAEMPLHGVAAAIRSA